MKWMIIELSATLVQCFISTDLSTRYFGWKKENRKNYIGFIIAFLAQVFITLIINKIIVFEGVAGIIYPTIVVIYAIIYLNGTFFEKIVIACIDTVLKMLTAVAVLTLISYFTPSEVASLITMQGIQRFIVLVMAQSTYFFSTRIVLRLQKNNKFSLSFMEWIAILGVFLTSFIAGVLVFEIIITSPKTAHNDFFAISVIISLILINVLCYYIFVNISSKNKEKLKYSLMELRLTEQEKSLMDMKQSYNEIRKIKHDMKNYIECATTLLHNGKSMEAKNYLTTLLVDKMEFGNQIVITNSDSVNAVISSKITTCKRFGIEFYYEITGDVQGVSEIDLSILLANLLDNAIEASKKVNNQAAIDVKLYQEKSYLVVLIKNKIDESVLKKNPNLKTTKKDKLQHGIGSLSIKDIVDKHNGIMTIYEKNEQFIVDIWLKVENQVNLVTKRA